MILMILLGRVVVREVNVECGSCVDVEEVKEMKVGRPCEDAETD